MSKRFEKTWRPYDPLYQEWQISRVMLDTQTWPQLRKTIALGRQTVYRRLQLLVSGVWCVSDSQGFRYVLWPGTYWTIYQFSFISCFFTPEIVLSTFILFPLHFLKAMFQEGLDTKDLLIKLAKCTYSGSLRASHYTQIKVKIKINRGPDECDSLSK